MGVTMTTRTMLVGGLSALLMGGTMVGCAANGGGIASASDRSATVASKSASVDAARASKALAKRDAAAAVPFAEQAVALAPQRGDYRLLLGQSYLQAGRFASARSAFGDAVQLDPGNGRAALNLALATIATGDFASARQVLATHTGTIPVADHGLALALAGDPQGAVALLMPLARSQQSNAKVRQNLAISLALAGEWQGARVVAAADMSPADVDRRMQDWARFARPAAASDQVALLLGVTASADAGQPVALALNVPPMVSTKAPIQTAALTSAPGFADAAPAPSQPAVQAPAALVSPALVKTVFGPSLAVVQPLPVRVLQPSAGATKVALARVAAAPAPAMAPAGPFYIQLGAFQSAGVAQDAWGHAARRFAAFAGRTPSAMTIQAHGAALYRLSVGGYARDEADAVCRRYRTSGGVCFVRRGAGDEIAAWARKGVQLAAR